MKIFPFLLGALFFAATCDAQAPAPADSSVKPAPGKLIERVACTKTPEQSYALYLPSTYSPDRSWPVVFAFDPGARGKIPVELMKDAAERYGYIVLGSNNSQNGAWKPEFDAADAMLKDAEVRFAVDWKRIYFAGFSGGARVASQLAQLCKCSAGVLLSGAGFSRGSPPSRETAFPVFSAVGNFDFNYNELIPLQEKLEQAGYPHWLRVFEGPHQWAPADVMDEALAWFRIQSMRTNREPRSDTFLSAEMKAEADRVQKLESGGDLYGQWKELKQASSLFQGILAEEQFTARANALAGSKSVHDGQKREKQEFAEQEQLTDEISREMTAHVDVATSATESTGDLAERIAYLRKRADEEKHLEKQRVLKRAIAGIFAQAMEAGSERQEAKDFGRAKYFFGLGLEADPQSAWPLMEFAVVYALENNQKAALNNLRKARKLVKDPTRFLDWASQEPAFTKLRDSTEFQNILHESNANP